jgi:hypothetical protein
VSLFSQIDGEACAVFALSVQPRHHRTIPYHVLYFQDNYSYLLRNLSAITAPTRHIMSETLTLLTISLMHLVWSCESAPRHVSSFFVIVRLPIVFTTCPRLLQASRTLHTPLPPRIHTNWRDTNDLQFPKSSQSSAIEGTSTPV